MGKLVSDLDYQDVLGTSQGDYKRVEYISNTTPVVINSDICPNEKTKFEIKLCLGESPKFWMGSYDFTEGRKTARLFSEDGRYLTYDYPDDMGYEGRTKCRWSLSRPDTFHEEFPHVIEFGNKFIRDLTSNYRETSMPIKSFSTRAPFGLFGIVEYKGDGLRLGYIIPKSKVYKLYYFKAFEKDLLIAEMIPVKDSSGTLCLYDTVRNRYFYPVNESGEIVNLTTCKKPSKDNSSQEEKLNSITTFFRKKFESLQCAIKGAWEFKYIGDKLKVIQHKTKKEDVVPILVIIPLILLLFGVGTLVYKIIDWSLFENKENQELVVKDNNSSLKEPIINRINEKADEKVHNTGKVSATIKNVYVDHNIEKDGMKGMQIAVEFESQNLKGKVLYCMVRFYNDDGSPLAQKSNNEKYRSINGNVIVGEYTYPPYDDCKTKTTLFIPYEELPVKTIGRTDLLLDASILHYTTNTGNEVLDRGKTYSFYIVKD